MEKHQIITVGKDFDTVYLGIKEFKPKVLHLLVTKESRRLCSPLLDMLPSDIAIREYLVGPYDVEAIMSICSKIISDNPQANFTVNLSEGTKIMAMAVAKVASERNCYCFYITQDGYYIDTCDYRRKPLTKGISNAEYIKLYGGSVREYEDVSQIKSLDINTAYYVKKFIEQHYDIYRQAKSWYRVLNIPKTDRYFFSGTLPNGCSIECDSGSLSIYRGLEVYFDSACRRSCELMFLGRWWEVIVADVVAEWKRRCSGSETASGIWHDVVFNEQSSSSVKNEIDLLVNDSQRLLLIECKSGEVTSADVFKIDSVCRTYGGNNSKAILVSYLPLTPSLLEKCRDLGIYCFAPSEMESRSKHIKKLPDWLDSVVQTHQL